MVDERHFETVEAAALALAEDMVDQLRRAICERGTASMAVSGGRTPRHVFPALAAAEVDWRHVCVTLTDERLVDPGHKDSNEGLVRRLLLRKRAVAASFVGLNAERIEDKLNAIAWPLDAVFLGIGEDGHIASLFPNDWNWETATGRCIAIAKTDTRQARISLSPGALLNCRRIFIILSGPAKTAVFKAAKRNGSANEIPLRLVLHQTGVPVSVYVAD